MQILGKRSRILLIAVAIIMLITIGVSFAMWDMSAVKATNGDLSDYANAKVGDIVEFGQYYQTGKRINNDENGEYEKTPIEWIVVDKDERTGQLTLMSKYILACGSYFGNWYDDGSGSGYNWYYNNKTVEEVGGVSHNQAYVDSTARAFLNNLERLDMGGDMFDVNKGYIPSGINSTRNSYDSISGNFKKGTGLLSSVGFSNQRYWTKLYTTSNGNISELLNNSKSGLFRREDTDNTEIYYKRPIKNSEYLERPMTRGFFDEAFTEEDALRIVPKIIAGYTGHRWPDNAHDISTNSYVEGAVDKVWLPSAYELNVMNADDWNGNNEDSWTNPSDKTSSTVFEYFRNYSQYKNPFEKRLNTSLTDAVKSVRTPLAQNGSAGNYSIPIYDKGTTTPKTAINTKSNSTNHYWTRSPSSYWYNCMRMVGSSGSFSYVNTPFSYIGIRPCVILKY